MAAQDSDSDKEDFVTYGKPLEQLEEGEPAKKPVPLQEQTVKDEKGRYKRFHGAFTGGYSAGYYNTVGSKEGWTPSAFVSSRQEKAERLALQKPEDFMDEEDLGEHGIAPNEIKTTDDFASKAKDRIQEKAQQLSSLSAPIPGAAILQDLIASAKLPGTPCACYLDLSGVLYQGPPAWFAYVIESAIRACGISIGVQLLHKMGWKEGQGIGPRTKRKPRRQKTDLNVKVYGCSLPPERSDGSEDDEDEYQPENVTFAPKDVIPIDFTLKDNVQGLGYKGIDPLRAFFGTSQESQQMLSDHSEKTNSLLGDIRQSKGRKLGISGQAFGVGALEEDDDDIYGTDFLSKYDTVLNDEEPEESLFGWTAPKEYKKQKASQKEIRYVGKILDGFSLASVSTAPKKIYLPPDLPNDYRPVHYFRPMLSANKENSQVLQVMLKPTEKSERDTPQASRHQLSSSQRSEILGETSLQGPSSVLELLSEKDREKILEVKQSVELQKAKTRDLALQSLQSRFLSASTEKAQNNCQPSVVGQSASAVPSDFQPFAKNPEKQERYVEYIRKLKEGHKDALESCSDFTMTEWERRREQDEFMRAAMLYKSSSSTLSCRFTRAKYEDDTETVEVPRDMENDATDKEAAAKMKMFGKLTRDKFEWHPAKLLCKRFNIPDPYPGSTLVGLPKVKRDKYSVFNFLTVPEMPSSKEINEKVAQPSNEDKTKKQSRWNLPAEEKKNDSLSEFLSLARSEIDVKQKTKPFEGKESKSGTLEQSTLKADKENIEAKPDEDTEESRPSLDLFKAIFASSSDEKSSSSSSAEDSEEEETPVAVSEAKILKEPIETPLTDVKDMRVTTKEPVLSTVPPSMQNQGPDSDDAFGPKLPPISSSGATRIPEEVKVVTPTQTLQNQKSKKKKEKHKTKKDHKHKKEKSKKHQKHKHKSKQKNKKTKTKSSSDTSESSDESGHEMPKEISPRELLKRLKRLSDSR